MATTVSPINALVDPTIESEYVRACIQNPHFAQRNVGRIPNNIFVSEEHQWIMQQLKRLMGSSNKGKVKRIPPEVLRAATCDIQDENKRKLTLLVIDALYKKPAEYEEFAEEEMNNYAAFQVLSAGVREFIGNYQKTKNAAKTLEIASDSINRSRSILANSAIYDYATNWSEREMKRKKDKELSEINVVVELGIKDFDEQVKIIPGTVTGFVAPFKKYKSIVLNHVGFSALLKGYNVLHVTLENTVEMTSDRYDARFSGISYNKICSANKTVQESEQFNKILGRIDSWPNRLKVFAGQAYKTTVLDIEAQIEHLESNRFSVDVVILDYGNIFAPSIKKKEDYDDQNQITWDMQAIAKKGSRPRAVITAFQANREALQEDSVKQHQIGKSIGIIQALDSAVAINQTEEEKAIDIIRLSPLVLRNGPIMKSDCELNSDLSRMCISKETDALWDKVIEWDND